MKQYSPKVECPKCGHGSMPGGRFGEQLDVWHGPVYGSGGDPIMVSAQGSDVMRPGLMFESYTFPDRLIWTCSRCGYQHSTATNDQKNSET